MFIEASKVPRKVRLSCRVHLVLAVHFAKHLATPAHSRVAPPSWVLGEYVS